MTDNEKDFEQYLAKYCVKEGVDRETALGHKIIQSYKEYLDERTESELYLRNIWEGSKEGDSKCYGSC